MELRQDYLTAQWVSIAPERSRRPSSFKKTNAQAYDDAYECPFCFENRHLTPAETYTYKNIRVVPNKYPALDDKTPPGYGFHEVLIESPEHRETSESNDIPRLTDILTCIRHRIAHFAKDEKIRYVQVFKNHGYHAGASLAHAHWQLMALPVVPFMKQTMRANFEKYEARTGRCYLCDVAGEVGGLTVFETENVVAWCPYASLYHYGVNVTTKSHAPDFTALDADMLSQLAAAISITLKALEVVSCDLSYNICFHLAPMQEGGGHDAWHFYMQIIPRMANFAGFELGTGCFINSADPADVARVLRQARSF